MLKRVIRSIRRQPKAVRDQYAFWGAGMFTALVAFVWLFGGVDRSIEIANLTVETVELESVQSVPQEASVLESFRDVIESFQTVVESPATDTINSIPVVEEPSATATPVTPVPESTDTTVTNPATPEPLPIEVRIATYTASGTDQ